MVTKAFRVGRSQTRRKRECRGPTWVVAFDPGGSEDEAEKEVLAAAPAGADDCVPWMYILFSLPGSCWNCRQRFQDHVVLVQLGVHGVDLALAEGIVESVDRRCEGAMPRREAVTRSMASDTVSPPVC